MSLLSREMWRERVLIGLSPERLSALRISGVLRTTVAARLDMDFGTEPDNNWSRAVAAVEDLLHEEAWRGLAIEIVLSNHFAHYVVLPSGQTLAPAEQDALAQLFFRNAYGDLARDWELRVSPAAHGAATVASGVPRGLLEALRAGCANKGRLRSIRPGLMAVINRARHMVGTQTGSLAIVEPGRITLVAIEGGEWFSIAGRSADGEDLPQLVEQENELLGRASGGTLWLCDMSGRAQVPSGNAWVPLRLLPALATGEAREVPGLATWGIP